MCVCILNNPNNKILEGIFDNKIILTLEILMIIYYCIITFIRKSLNLAFYICPYFLFSIFLYIMFYLGDISNYKSNESVHFISIFITVLPIFIVVFNLWLKNSVIICRGLTLKLEENFNLKINQIQKIIEEKEKDQFKSNQASNNDFAFKINKPEEDILKKYSIDELVLIKDDLVKFKYQNFKFSLKNLFLFLFRNNVKSLINS